MQLSHPELLSHLNWRWDESLLFLLPPCIAHSGHTQQATLTTSYQIAITVEHKKVPLPCSLDQSFCLLSLFFCHFETKPFFLSPLPFKPFFWFIFRFFVEHCFHVPFYWSIDCFQLSDCIINLLTYHGHFCLVNTKLESAASCHNDKKWRP